MSAPEPFKVERRPAYQGVPQWGLNDGSAEITPTRATAEKWARLANAERAARCTPRTRS